MAFSAPAHIFKAYDIRGLAASELSPELAYALGRFFVEYLKKEYPGVPGVARSVVVGRDMRATSSALQEAVMRGVSEGGMDVVDIGLTSTPLFNFACAHYPEHAGGIMVTASHNPGEYNGFKMTLGSGLPVPGSAFAACQTARLDRASEPGKIMPKNVLAEYIKKLFSLVRPEEIQPFKIVVDLGSGMGGVTLANVLRAVPTVQVEYLYDTPDGTFPHHEANPLKIETLRDLQARVRASGAALGFALDGDGDRCGLVDERGEVVAASQVGALLGLEVLRSHPGATMMHDVRVSAAVGEVWREQGAAQVLPTPVGHANIKRDMPGASAAFACELSLHVYYQDLYYLEAPDLALLHLLRLLSRERRSLSQIIGPLQRYHHSGEINFTVADKEAVIKEIEARYRESAQEILYLDGLTMKFDWGWFNVRVSNTEPVLRLNLETIQEPDLKEKIQEISALIKHSG